MWKIEYRNMSPGEREELRAALRSFSCAGREVLGAVLGALGGLTASWAAVPLPAFVLATVVAGACLGVAAAQASRPRSHRALREALRQDLRNGKVQVFHVVPREVLRIRTTDTSVAGYLVDVGCGQVMFIEPREWEYPEGDPESAFERLFPCTRFSLARAPRSKADLGFTCDGESFPPRRDIEVTLKDLGDFPMEDGELLWGSLKTLERPLN
jgi:hypothetical protein